MMGELVPVSTHMLLSYVASKQRPGSDITLAQDFCKLFDETLYAPQEQLQLGQQAQTLHSPPASLTYRVQLSPDVLDPLCHGLGHAIFRLALAMQHNTSTETAAGLQFVSLHQQGGSGTSLATTLGNVAGNFAQGALSSKSVACHPQETCLYSTVVPCSCTILCDR